MPDERRAPQVRVRRFGRLAPAPGVGMAVRCACTDCGAHVMAIALAHDDFRGVCLVCGGESLTPV